MLVYKKYGAMGTFLTFIKSARKVERLKMRFRKQKKLKLTLPSSTNNEMQDEKNSSKLGHASEKMARCSSSIAAKNEVTETMLAEITPAVPREKDATIRSTSLNLCIEKEGSTGKIKINQCSIVKNRPQINWPELFSHMNL
nr:RNA polymerase III RPC4 [Tanacetum cinerariifolium]